MKYCFIVLLAISGLEALLDPSQRDHLIKTYAPLVRLHPEEDYFPSSVEWFIKHCSLKKKQSGSHLTVKQKGTVTIADLAQYTTDNYYLNLEDSDAKKGQQKNGSYYDAPCYVNFVESDTGVLIQYIFFYPYNGAFQTKIAVVGDIVSAITEEFQIGDHKGDWEHINVELKRTGAGYKMQTVYFARHRPSQDGGYDAPELFENTHPVVYASKYGHASHPHYSSSKAPNYDALSRSGPEWRTWEHPVYVGQKTNPTRGNEWIKFGGRWGSADNSPLTPTYQPWWRTSMFQVYKPRELVTKIAAVVGPKNETVTKGSLTIKKNSINFKMNATPPTYIHTLYWTIEKAPTSVTYNTIRFSVFDKNNNKLFDIAGPTKATFFSSRSIPTEEMYIGNLTFTQGSVKEGQVNIRVEYVYDSV